MVMAEKFINNLISETSRKNIFKKEAFIKLHRYSNNPPPLLNSLIEKNFAKNHKCTSFSFIKGRTFQNVSNSYPRPQVFLSTNSLTNFYSARVYFHLLGHVEGFENCWIDEFKIYRLCVWPSNLCESHRVKVERSIKIQQLRINDVYVPYAHNVDAHPQ